MYRKPISAHIDLYEMEDTDIGQRWVSDLGLIKHSDVLSDYFGRLLEARYGADQLWEQELLCWIDYAFDIRDVNSDTFLDQFSKQTRDYWFRVVRRCEISVSHGEGGFSFSWVLDIDISDSVVPLLTTMSLKTTVDTIESLSIRADEDSLSHPYWTFLKLKCG
jgi:hypothetical protein